MDEEKKLSFDTNDFDISFARGISLEDGVATLTDFTASIIGQELSSAIIDSKNEIKESQNALLHRARMNHLASTGNM